MAPHPTPLGASTLAPLTLDLLGPPPLR